MDSNNLRSCVDVEDKQNIISLKTQLAWLTSCLLHGTLCGSGRQSDSHLLWQILVYTPLSASTWNLTNSCTLNKTAIDSWESKHGTSSQLQTTLWCIQANLPKLQHLFLAMFAIMYITLTDTEMLSWFLYTQSKLRRIKSSIRLCHLGYSLTI